ncbi:MAG: hypothetical protein HC786_02980 [Richelia sp. CSU_2_1]|nr:hypothetical protein [Richelia sp. CSU_2_1]
MNPLLQVIDIGATYQLNLNSCSNAIGYFSWGGAGLFNLFATFKAIGEPPYSRAVSFSKKRGFCRGSAPVPTPPTDDLMRASGIKGRHGGTAPTQNETALPLQVIDIGATYQLNRICQLSTVNCQLSTNYDSSEQNSSPRSKTP